MEHTEDSISVSSSRYKNPFLACFGFSEVVVEKKNKKVNSSDRKKDRWRFPWSRLRKEKIGLCKRVYADEKLGRKNQGAVTGEMSGRKGKQKPARDVIVEHSESFDAKKPTKTSTCQARLLSDKKQEAKKEKSNLPQSLELGSESIQQTSLQSKASSLTSQKRKKKVSIKGEIVLANEKKAEEKSESLYGLSIVMVTLLIMLVWGKLCAIICTSVWLYFISRFKKGRSGASDNSVGKESTHENSSIDYEKHKKKVVLEGFLERNNRSRLRILHSNNMEVG